MAQVLTVEFEHTLFAGPMWVHPGNGNVYCCVVGKEHGTKQHLQIWRWGAPEFAWKLVKTLLGGGVAGAVSPGQITLGAAAIGKGGALFVSYSAPTWENPAVWVPQVERVPNFDEPYGFASAAELEALQSEVAALRQQLADSKEA